MHRNNAELQTIGGVEQWSLGSSPPPLRNVGYLNNRYSPWGGNPYLPDDPNRYNAAIKDPLAWRSDNWDFPNSEPLSLTMLGRVHRGTPWQTIYLKSAHADPATWLDWLHTDDAQSAQLTHPTHDWRIADLIASLLNTNSPRELLSVNERDTNTWLLRLDGLTVLTNKSLSSSPSFPPAFDSIVISSNSIQAATVVAGIATTRADQLGSAFRSVGELLATPELSLSSPWLNQSSNVQVQSVISDKAYERLPVQLLPLLRADSMGSVIWSDDGWHLQFTGFDNYPYAVESSPDLVNWSSINTNFPTNGVFSLPLTVASNQFFRSRLLP